MLAAGTIQTVIRPTQQRIQRVEPSFSSETKRIRSAVVVDVTTTTVRHSRPKLDSFTVEILWHTSAMLVFLKVFCCWNYVKTNTRQVKRARNALQSSLLVRLSCRLIQLCKHPLTHSLTRSECPSNRSFKNQQTKPLHSTVADRPNCPGWTEMSKNVIFVTVAGRVCVCVCV